MPETTISQRSPLADYFDDQNIGPICPAALNSCSLATLVCGADKNFLAAGSGPQLQNDSVVEQWLLDT